jgi:hypothetical protein
MRNFKYIFLFFLLAGIVPACVEDTAPEDAFGKTPNLVSFTSATANLSAVATGDEFVLTIPMEVEGPSFRDIDAPVTATVSVDPASTAIEGVHYRLDDTSITFDPSNNMLANFPITVITEGLEPPLAAAPTLVLRVSGVSGVDNVIATGKPISINLLYLCSSELAATYNVHIVRTNAAGVVTEFDFEDPIVQTGDGEYRGVSVAHYAPGSLGGTPGFTFLDVCGELTVPLQNLVDLYSNEVYGVEGGSYVKENGDLHIEYIVTFAAGNSTYVADYAKQ